MLPHVLVTNTNRLLVFLTVNDLVDMIHCRGRLTLEPVTVWGHFDDFLRLRDRCF